MDPSFTAQMEEELDEVGAGSSSASQLLKRFYKRFREQLDKSKKLAPVEARAREDGHRLRRVRRRDDAQEVGQERVVLVLRALPGVQGDEGPRRERRARRRCARRTSSATSAASPWSSRRGASASSSRAPATRRARTRAPCRSAWRAPSAAATSSRSGRASAAGAPSTAARTTTPSRSATSSSGRSPSPIPCPQCGAKFLTRAGGKKPMLICATKDCGYKQELGRGGGRAAAPATNGERARRRGGARPHGRRAPTRSRRRSPSAAANGEPSGQGGPPVEARAPRGRARGERRAA